MKNSLALPLVVLTASLAALTYVLIGDGKKIKEQELRLASLEQKLEKLTLSDDKLTAVDAQVTQLQTFYKAVESRQDWLVKQAQKPAVVRISSAKPLQVEFVSTRRKKPREEW